MLDTHSSSGLGTGVTIAIPTYNRSRLLASTLESLFSLQVPCGLSVEIVVIDNNCTDDTAAVIQGAAPRSPFPIRHIVEARQGLCYCRNRAIEEARYEHVVYFDDDVNVAPEWLLGYMDAVENYQADCVVGPVFPNFETAIPSLFTPRVVDSLTSYYSRKGDNVLLLPQESASEVPGCNFGVRKSVAAQIGGFRCELDRVGKELLAGGDTEFGWRLGKYGKRIVYHPKCRIEHILTSEKLSKQYLRKRWYGGGVTRRLLHQYYGRPLTFRRRIRYTVGILRLCVGWLWARISKPEGIAFEKELQLRDVFGYLWGRY